MSLANHAIEYSILICTYNPDERLLARCLNAVLRQDIEGISREIILVDNNSSVPLGELAYIREFLQKAPDMRLITVKEQGLTAARIGGVETASGKYIVFFDDDNEPETNYLQELKRLHTAHLQVAAWGPGQISVDFIDGIDKRLEALARPMFQERHNEQLAFASLPEWQGCYPFGTGLCLLATILRDFIAATKQGRFTLTDRKGNNLSSGGDTQMVLYAVSTGASAGVSPGLRLTHIIPAKRANHGYMKRLVYGTRLCYETCLVQVFPEYRAKVQGNYISAAKFVRRTAKGYARLLFKRSPGKRYELVNYIGGVAANYLVLNKPVPRFVKLVLKCLRAE